MNKVIYYKHDIWDTKMRMIQHRDGTITIKMPYTKWVNNSGSLDFEKIKISDPKKIKAIKKYFEKDEIVDDYGLSIFDCITFNCIY